jgi:phage gp16-like protein
MASMHRGCGSGIEKNRLASATMATITTRRFDMTKKPMTAAADRARLIKLVLVGCRELGMDEDTYRLLLSNTVKGKSSTIEMTTPELEKIMRAMRAKGFTVRHKSKSVSQSRALAQYPEATKIRALWLFLHQLGAVNNPAEVALATYVKRITKVDALQWLNGQQTETVIESLKKWAMRFLPQQVQSMAQMLETEIKVGNISLSEKELFNLRYAISHAQQRQTFDPMQVAWDALKATLDKGGT